MSASSQTPLGYHNEGPRSKKKVINVGGVGPGRALGGKYGSIHSGNTKNPDDVVIGTAEARFLKYNWGPWSTVFLLLAAFLQEMIRVGIPLMALIYFQAGPDAAYRLDGPTGVLLFATVCLLIHLSVRFLWLRFSGTSGPAGILISLFSGRYSANFIAATIIAICVTGGQLLGATVAAYWVNRTAHVQGLVTSTGLLKDPTSPFNVASFNIMVCVIWGFAMFGNWMCEWANHQYVDVNSHAIGTRTNSKQSHVEYTILAFVGALGLPMFEAALALALGPLEMSTYAYWTLNFAAHTVLKTEAGNVAYMFGGAFIAFAVAAILFAVVRYFFLVAPELSMSGMFNRHENHFGDRYNKDRESDHRFALARYANKVRTQK